MVSLVVAVCNIPQWVISSADAPSNCLHPPPFSSSSHPLFGKGGHYEQGSKFTRTGSQAVGPSGRWKCYGSFGKMMPQRSGAMTEKEPCFAEWPLCVGDGSDWFDCSSEDFLVGSFSSSSSSYARRRCLSPSRKRLSSSAPPGCHRACPSVVSVLATCPTSKHHVVGSAAVDVLQS